MELDFNKNLGDTDRVIRIIIGLVLIGVAQYTFGSWTALTYFIGFAQLIEAYFAY